MLSPHPDARLRIRTGGVIAAVRRLLFMLDTSISKWIKPTHCVTEPDDQFGHRPEQVFFLIHCPLLA